MALGFTTKSIDFANPLKAASFNIAPLLNKGSIVNLDTNETYQFMFNPTEIRQPDIKAIYDEANVAFRSHPKLRYKYTTGAEWVFTLYLNSISSNGQNVINLLPLSKNINNDVSFLKSLVYPIEAEGIENRRPPNCRFVWPKLANVRVRVMSVSTLYQKFNFQLQQQVTSIDLVLRENPENNQTSNLIRTRGANGRPGLLGSLIDSLPSGVGDAVDKINSFI